MSKEFKYFIEIKFSRVKVTKSLGKMQVPRYQGRGTDDVVSFAKNKITINAYRSNKYTTEQILSATNTLNQQIVKTIIMYYANALNFPKIKDIKCKLIMANSVYITHLSGDSVLQIFDYNAERDSWANFYHDSLKNEDDLGVAVRIAVSRWMLAINTTNNSYVRFNYLWTAFNALYSYYGGQGRECDKLTYIREQICNLPQYFSTSINKVSGYDAEKLRFDFRWKLMCINDIRNSAAPLVNTILAYSDSRIIDLFKGLRREHQINQSINAHQRVQDVDLKLNSAGVVSDIELVALISTKYAYYLRNVHQHGQVVPSAYKIQPTRVDKEFNMINDLLSHLIFEILINCENIPKKL